MACSKRTPETKLNNPFDLENYKRQITMTAENTALKSSYQQTAAINRARAKGVEPSINYSDKAPNVDPKRFVTDMPVMPKHVRTLRKTKMKDTPAPQATSENFEKTDSTGMTMRDHFAKYAMQAFLVDYQGTDWPSRAKEAYQMADAMLERRVQ